MSQEERKEEAYIELVEHVQQSSMKLETPSSIPFTSLFFSQHLMRSHGRVGSGVKTYHDRVFINMKVVAESRQSDTYIQ